MTDLQNKQSLVINPHGIDKAVEDIRNVLKQLTWVSHPFHIAQRFIRKIENKLFTYPEIYIVDPDNKIESYHRLTPDNDYTGMFFFFVGNGRSNEDGYMEYNVSIIFSVNLELIDENRLKNEHLFTQDLIDSVRKKIKSNRFNFDSQMDYLRETRDLKEVYREFVLDNLEEYNRAPLQCFRVELLIKIDEEC